MLKIKRYALTMISAIMLMTAVCPMTAIAAEGLAGLQDQTTVDNTTDGSEGVTGLTDMNELEANDYMPGVDGGDAGTNTPTPLGNQSQEEEIEFNGHNTDTGNAIDDILNNERYSGAMSSITKVTDLVDKWFIVIISVVAFFIISAAMLKNVCAGAYVANPKFWDIVHESHQKVGQQSLSGIKSSGIGLITNSSFSSIRDILLVIVPDLKAFTDFEDASSENIDPKAYFAKSIPQMLICVIIGIFIYNGYYRDTASKVGAFGAESFERFIGEADPVALADRLYNTTGKPKTKYDMDKSNSGRLGKAIADKTYSLYVSTYHDLTGPGTKAALMDKIVQDTDSYLKDVGEYLGADTRSKSGYEYNFSVDVYKSTGEATDKVVPSKQEQGNVVLCQRVFRLISNDVLGMHYTDIDPATTGMTSVTVVTTFTKDIDQFTSNADGYIDLEVPDGKSFTYSDVKTAFGDTYNVPNKGTNVKYNRGNLNGMLVRSASDGKVYTVHAIKGSGDSLKAGKPVPYNGKEAEKETKK